MEYYALIKALANMVTSDQVFLSIPCLQVYSMIPQFPFASLAITAPHYKKGRKKNRLQILP